MGGDSSAIQWTKERWFRAAKQRDLLAERVNAAERAMRDMAKERDQWKARALAAEAKIASLT